VPEAQTKAVLHPDRHLMIGSIFLGRYRIVGELGRGGMGVVYKAEDTKLKRNVALKFLPPDLTRDPGSKERFIHEAQAASALDHPSICTVHEIDESDGQIFISMGCYEGETLKDRIEKGPLQVGDAIGIAIQVAQGLEEAHEKGIIHRDIKPSNIMVTTKKQAKVMDFGLAKLAGQTRITKAGTTMGTIAYMSPEQARGEDIDHRTDIWSLGVVLYEMLAGSQPFKGEYDQAVIYSILNEAPKPLTEIDAAIPAEADAIVSKCLSKMPVDRYQSSGELVADLIDLSKVISPSGYGRLHTVPYPLVPGRSKVLRVIIPAAVIALAAILVSVVPPIRGALMRLVGGVPESGETRVALLPCSLSGGSATDTAFCYGMASTLTDRLTLLERFKRGLFVTPSRDVRYLDDMTPSGVRRAVGANVVLSGVLARTDDEISLRPVRVDVGVTRGRDSEAETFMERRGAMISDPAANLATWQDSILVEMAKLLGIELGEEARELVFATGTTVPEAYILYLEGMGYLYPYGGGGSREIDTALVFLGRAVEADSSYVLAHVGLARAFNLKGQTTRDPSWYMRAVAECDRALESSPNYADAHVVAGNALDYAGDTDAAIDRFKQAVGIDGLGIDAYTGMADALRHSGDYEGAESVLHKAAALRPLDVWIQERLSYVLILQGKFEDATKTASRTIELRPNDTRGYNDLATAYSCLHRTDEARAAFERSLEIDSNYVACTNLGTIYFGLARYADAARMYERALNLEPDNYRIAGFLSEAYYWSPGLRELGVETFRRAIQLAESGESTEDRDATLLSDLASYYARVGNSSKSESLLVQATLLEPVEWPVLFRIADTYEQMGMRESALEWVKRALEHGAPLETMDHFPGLRGLRTDKRYRDIIAHWN
jgi:tetratricopeptide (TPR) repeat protein